MTEQTPRRKPTLSAPLIALALVASWAAATSAAAAATPPPTVVDWRSLRGVAHEAFDAGPGEAHIARIQGLAAAADASPGAWEQLDLDTRLDRDFSGPADPGFEVSLDAVVAYRLGGLASARAHALRARIAAREAARAMARWEFEREAIARFVVWWAAHARASHLEGHLGAMAEQLAPVRAAVARHRLTRLVLSDLEIEVARLRVELANNRRAEAIAADALGVWLGRAVQPRLASAADLDDTPLPAANPWSAALSRVKAHPELALLDARAAALSAQAAAADAADSVSLTAGLGVRQEGEGSTWGALIVGLSVPLSNPEAADAERLRAAARATSLDRAWRVRALAREVGARAARWDAVRAQLEQVRDDLIAPMRARVTLIEGAMLEGRATLEQLVRARRDELEAHHETIHDLAELRAAALEAEAFAALLADGAPPATGAPR